MDHETRCDQCGKQYDCIMELGEHRKIEHGIEKEGVVKDENGKKSNIERESKGNMVEMVIMKSSAVAGRL